MIAKGLAAELNDKPGVLGIGLLVGIAVVPVLDGSTLLREQMILAAVTAIQAYALQFVWRYCGVFSMAYGALTGIGGYSCVLLTLHAGAPFWVGMLVAIPASLLLGVILGLASLRAGAMSYAMMTYAFVAALEIFADNGGAFSGGTSGLTVVEPMSFGFMAVNSGSELSPFYLLYGLLLASVVVVVGLKYTRLGKRLVAGRDNESLARGLGIFSRRQRVIAITVSGLITTLAGSVYSIHEFHVEPDLFGATQSLQIVAVLVLGGLTRWSGPIVGAAIVIFLPQYLGLSPVLTQIVYGAVLVVVVIAFPAGLSGAAALATSRTGRLRHRLRGRVPLATEQLDETGPGLTDVGVRSPE